MKKVYAKRSWIFFVVLALVLVLVKTPVFAASVSDFAGLKAAANRGDSSITITGNIIVTETLEIKKDVTISGDPKNRPKLILADDFSKDRFAEGGAIKIEDSTLTIDGTSFIDNHLDSSVTDGGR